MLVGSHGLERTGFTNDIELSVGVTDGSAGPDSYVGRLRRQLWAEFLQLSPDDPLLIDPIGAVAEFDRQAALGDRRVRRYWPHEVPDTWAMDQVYAIYEPEGRCGHNASGAVRVSKPAGPFQAASAASAIAG
jgi:hypothetical protein